MDGFKQFACTKRQAELLLQVFRGGSGGANLEDVRIFRQIRNAIEEACGAYHEHLEELDFAAKEAEGTFTDELMLLAARRKVATERYELEQGEGQDEVTLVLQLSQWNLLNRVFLSPALRLPLTDPEVEGTILDAIERFQGARDVELRDGAYVEKAAGPTSLSARGERRRQDRISRKLIKGGGA